MSLAIQIGDVIGVFMDDGWHTVVDNSFLIDAYEFLEDDYPMMGGGTVAGVSDVGARWREPDGSYVACPVPAIKAVRYAPKPAPDADVLLNTNFNEQFDMN
jgi:hypothetical protein